MKLQIDTDKKTIKIEDKINLSELIDKLNMLFPNDTWKEYTLESNIINNWINPVYVKPYQTIWGRPCYNNFEVYCGTTSTLNSTGGVNYDMSRVSTLTSSNTVHNIELN